MPLQQCSRGHFFDPVKHAACPVCSQPRGEVDVTRAAPRSGAIEQTRMNRPEAAAAAPPPDDEPATRAVMPTEKTLTCGWLVCIEGPDRGKDFRIRSGRNFIGRGSKMQICIPSDETIHRENHAAVTYDPRRARFALACGMIDEFIYLNGDIVEPASPRVLTAYDIIEIGKSRLMFMPFCGDKFQWKE